MKNKPFIYIFSVLTAALSVLAGTASANDSVGGLSVFGNSLASISERTSYQVFTKMQRFPDDSLVISFDAAFTQKHVIGHILSCRTKEEEVFTLFAKQDMCNSDIIYVNLNLPRSAAQVSVPVDVRNERLNSWFNVRIKLDFIADTAMLEVDGKSNSCKLRKSCNPQKEKVNFHFGKFDHYLDVISFNIKDLQLTADRRKSIFPLDETEGVTVHNSKGKKVGQVCHPHWLYEQHVRWQEKAVISEDEIAAVFMDHRQSSILLYTSGKTYRYNIYTDELEPTLNPYGDLFRFSKGGGANYVQLPDRDKVILFNNQDSKNKKNSIAAYDAQAGRLDQLGNSRLITKFHHNAAFSDKKGENIYQFGGYGNFSYSDRFMKMDLSECVWKEVHFIGDRLTPRFYTAVTEDFSGMKEDIYLFGGYGNESGQQEAGGRHYHDLYRLDLKTGTIEKLMDLKNGIPEAVPCRDLIRNEDGSFYTMMYSHHIPHTTAQLYRIDARENTIIPYSDTIPFLSQKISTQVHLFESRTASCMICVIQEFSKPDDSRIMIYKIRTPLIPFQECSAIKAESGWIWIAAIILGVLMVMAVTIILVVAKKRRRRSAGGGESKQTETSSATAEMTPEEKKLLESIDNDNAPAISEEKEFNTLFILGDFTIFNRDGKDVSYLFSAKIRQLMMLIFMCTYRQTSNGITAKEISSIIWPEKEYAQSKNIRGVTIKNLRDALADIDGISLVSTNGKWLFEIDKEIFHCDYLQIIDADIRDINSYDGIRPFMHLLRRGSLLASEHYDWIDSFKADFEENILNNFGKKMRYSFKNAEYLISYKISQVLLSIDPLNEDLMQIEINSLIRMGDPVKAKIKFRQFSINYYTAYEKDLEYEDYVIRDNGVSTNRS